MTRELGRVRDALDAREQLGGAGEARGVHRRLVHAARVQVADETDVPVFGRGPRGVLEDLVQRLLVALVELAESAPDGLVLRDLRRREPAAVRVHVEVVARRDARVHELALDRPLRDGLRHRSLLNVMPAPPLRAVSAG
jgi:hypothetical protein